MTPLIEKLSIQAGLACDGTEFDDTAIQSFADMIINECISVVEKTDKTHGGTSYDINMIEGTIERSIKAIKKHFGKTIL